MNIINQFRIFWGKYFFRRDLRKAYRNRDIVNLHDAKSVAIVYDASNEETYKIVSEMVRYFQENQKVVKALGFVNYARLPHYCFPKLSYDYFTKRELNWWMKPTNARVADFIREEFDILIDLTTKECFPLMYAAGLSKARFKVGRFNEPTISMYDFMLHVNESINTEEYVREAMHYLSILKKSDKKTSSEQATSSTV